MIPFQTLLYSPGIIIAGAIAIFTAWYMYQHARHHVSGVAFLMMAISIGIWTMLLGIVPFVTDSVNSEYIRMAFTVFGVFIPPLIFLFSSSLASEHPLITKFTIATIYAPMVAVGAIAVIQNYKDVSLVVLLYTLGYLFASAYVLGEKYMRSAGIFRDYLRQLVTVGGGSIAILVLSMIFIKPSGNFLTLLSVVAVIASITVVFAGAVLARFYGTSVHLYVAQLFTVLTVLVLIIETSITSNIFDTVISLFTTILIASIGVILMRNVRQDIEGQKVLEQLYKELLHANQTLQDLDAEKSSLVSIASHHLRDPLTVIKGYTSMLLEGSFGELSSALREALERIFQSSKRLLHIVDDFLDVTRIESGEMSYTRKIFDFRALVLDVTRDLASLATRARLTLTAVVDPNLHTAAVNGDEEKLRQVISNLVDNAIKYNIAGGTITIRLGVTTHDLKSWAQLSVADTGIGLGETDFDHIFEKFGRAEGVSKIYTEGSGLGLYLAREILKQHGGAIWAESAGAGKGAVFYIELPMVEMSSKPNEG